MNPEAKEAIRNLAQMNIDIVVEQSRKSGTDVLAALEGLVLFHREALPWAEEALRREHEKRQ